AGGVGGLLAVTDSETGTSYPTYDANGNVSEYVSPTGAILAHYDYSPFGELLIATSSHPAPFRFSTKYHDPETGTLYYGYRHYSPRLGRWLSRDPIGENDALNLSVFCRNLPIERLDTFGLDSIFGPTDLDDFIGFPDSFDFDNLVKPPDIPFENGFPYIPDTSDGLGYWEGGMTYLGGDGRDIYIPVDQLGLPTDIESYFDPCFHKDSDWFGALDTLKRGNWNKAGPGRIVAFVFGILTFTNCCWTYEGFLLARDDKFDFNARKWKERDGKSFPLKEIATRTIGTMGKALNAKEFNIRFTGLLKINGKGCCSQ
ncbi:MAG: lipid II-degrading bacteriocin, partial [Kiritimatiellae bacterium]|nr:lipid II-degrading bacteriocin [Kiritimatiellia bacterium]